MSRPKWIRMLSFFKCFFYFNLSSFQALFPSPLPPTTPGKEPVCRKRCASRFSVRGYPPCPALSHSHPSARPLRSGCAYPSITMSFTGSSSNYARTHCQRHPKARGQLGRNGLTLLDKDFSTRCLWWIGFGVDFMVFLPIDNGEKDDGYNSSADVSPGQASPAKTGRTHQELHKELLLAHKKYVRSNVHM